MRRTAFLASLILLVASAAFAGHFVFNPGHPLTDAERADLASRGIVIQKVLTGGRYLVFSDETTARAAVSTDGRAALQPLTAEMKIHGSAAHEVARAKPFARLRVMFHDDVTFEEARRIILAAGAALEDPLATELGVMQQIDVVVPQAALDRLVSDDGVFVVAAAPLKKVASHNATSAAVSHVTELQTAPYDLTGSGVTASVFELAEGEAGHQEFQGRITVNFTGGESGDKSHATHVMGTIAAAGIDPSARGMAPSARLQEFRASGNAAAWLKLKDESLPAVASVADNNSWGYVLGYDSEGADWVWNDLAEYFGAYDLVYTAPIDKIARQRSILFVHSAGNEADLPVLGTFGQHKHVDDNGNTIKDKTYCFSANGSGTDCPASVGCTAGTQFCEKTRHMAAAPWDTISLTASGKNSIAVGAVDEGKQIALFSGHGPAKDGRVKPDLVARGLSSGASRCGTRLGVRSSSTGGGYDCKNGTSMAAPVVTGVAVLLTEQWRRIFVGTNPNSGQLKALLIAGADDLGNAGPDYTYGYGLVNAKASVDLIRADAGQQTRIKNGALAQGQTFDTALRVTTPEKLRVTLQWVDPEIAFLGGDEIAAKALVNDLDMTVTDPSGAVVKPWTLDRLTPTASAVRGTNTTDNTEVIEIPNAAPGIYRISVVGTRVTDQSPQAFTLVTSAPSAPPCVDSQEANNSADTAYGNLVPTQNVAAALCSASDVDFFKFAVTKGGEVKVTVNATGDLPIRATLLRDGTAAGTVDVPAGATRTLSFTIAGGALATPVNVVLRIEGVPGAEGIVPTYTFTPVFGQTVPPRSRAVRPR